MNIHIRKAEPGDIEMLVKFLHLLFTIEKDFTLDADKHRAGLHLLLENHRRGTIFVAETDVMLVGMATAQIVVSTASGGYSILLEDMYVEIPLKQAGDSEGSGQVIPVEASRWFRRKKAPCCILKTADRLSSIPRCHQSILSNFSRIVSPFSVNLWAT
jgi:hypothetical protein